MNASANHIKAIAILCAISIAATSQAVPIWQSILPSGLLKEFKNELLEAWYSLDSGLQFVGKQADSLVGCAGRDPDACRSVKEIIQSRGFQAEEHDVVTKDGYILTIQRIINPLVSVQDRPKLKPVILQHGLMSSSVDWVINSVHVKPTKWPASNISSDDNDETISNEIPEVTGDSQAEPNALGFYLANEGFDVFLANSRGNVYGAKHVKMSNWWPKFWDFTFDEQIQYDLPDTIELVQKLTNHTKVGYVGHSQGTTMIFGLLSERPEYADIVEPVVALAPVAYVAHCKSPAKFFSIYTPVFQSVNMRYGKSEAATRYLGPIVCGAEWTRKLICSNLVFLSSGFDVDQLDETRAAAYLSHTPSGTSFKNLAHWGQAYLSGEFVKFDLGPAGNQLRYNSSEPPAYDLSRVRSKSLVLFVADNDWLAPPEDVATLLRKLRVRPYRVFNITEDVPKWNHIDFTYGKEAGRFINSRIVDILRQFDRP